MKKAKDTVELRLEHRTAWITLDRAPLNILNIAMMEELGKALEKALPKCDFLVFQGAGVQAFSAGADVADHTPKHVEKMLSTFHGIFRQLAETDCLKIAAVHGYCLGGGMELASVCDFVLATESAQFGQPEIKLGCFPPVAMITLPQLIGMRAATQLILTGHQISATEAHRLGLVTRVVPDYQLLAALGELLEELRALSPAVLKLTARALRRFHAGEFAELLADAERVYLSELMQTKDAQEGIHAFLEKRPPVWKGK